MLLTPADFVGEYRLFNANNLSPDIVAAIDQAQEALARDLFVKGGELIINGPPTAPPNLGLRALGALELFLAWVFMNIQQPILGAGVKKASDVPNRNIFASGNFVKVAGFYRGFLKRWTPYEGQLTGTATAANTLVVTGTTADIICPNMEIIVNNVSYTVLTSVGGTITVTPATLPLGAITFVQNSMKIERNWVYF
jgi:hypothetical protein